MVFVPGGDYRLISWSRPTDRRVPLNDYFIDKYEVSNLEYKEFVNAGGYVKRELWRHPFVKDGRDDCHGTRPFARSSIGRDCPGRAPGRTRASLTAGRTSGHGRDVVRGRRVRGVSRQTVGDDLSVGKGRSQRLLCRRRASPPCRGGRSIRAIRLKDRANFGTGALPDDQRGIRHERLWRLQHGGERGRVDVERQLGRVSRHRRRVGRSDLHLLTVRRAPRLLQFRKAWVSLCASGDRELRRSGRAAHRARPGSAPIYGVVRAAVFETLASAYRYEKTPLDARIEQTVETPEWKREQDHVRRRQRRPRDRLPLSAQPRAPATPGPALPPGRRCRQRVSIAARLDGRSSWRRLSEAGAPRSAVVLEGYIERLRPAGFVRPAVGTVEFAEIVVSRVTDLRRGLDYLETRTDIDKARIGVIRAERGLDPRTDSRGARRALPRVRVHRGWTPRLLPRRSPRPPTRSTSRRTSARPSSSSRDATTKTRRCAPRRSPSSNSCRNRSG